MAAVKPIHGRARPLPTVSIVPFPGARYGIGERIKATLLDMKPGGHDSFLVDHVETAWYSARKIGVGIICRREGGKYRIWRIS